MHKILIALQDVLAFYEKRVYERLLAWLRSDVKKLLITIFTCVSRGHHVEATLKPRDDLVGIRWKTMLEKKQEQE